jgi:hypothetical protein
MLILKKTKKELRKVKKTLKMKKIKKPNLKESRLKKKRKLTKLSPKAFLRNIPIPKSSSKNFQLNQHKPNKIPKDHLKPIMSKQVSYSK